MTNKKIIIIDLSPSCTTTIIDKNNIYTTTFINRKTLSSFKQDKNIPPLMLGRNCFFDDNNFKKGRSIYNSCSNHINSSDDISILNMIK